MDLLQPQIETSVTEKDGTIEIQISADCFAPFVWLEIEDDVIFSDNCFDLTSEETKQSAYERKMFCLERCLAQIMCEKHLR